MKLPLLIIAVTNAFISTPLPLFKRSLGLVKSTSSAFEETVQNRYAVGRFDPSHEIPTSTLSRILSLAMRSPTSFNAQPYRVLVVSDPKIKSKLSKFFIGHNLSRIEGCSAVVLFLADLRCGGWRGWRELVPFYMGRDSSQTRTQTQTQTQTQTGDLMTKNQAMYTMFLVSLFSSTYPLLPSFLSRFVSKMLRLFVNIFNLGRWKSQKLLLPTLSSSRTWSVKNTCMVAMAFMLGCSAEGLETCPMEGYNQEGVRGALGIGRRYDVPLVVAVGKKVEGREEPEDGVGVKHGRGEGGRKTRRFPGEEKVTFF